MQASEYAISSWRWYVTMQSSEHVDGQFTFLHCFLRLESPSCIGIAFHDLHTLDKLYCTFGNTYIRSLDIDAVVTPQPALGYKGLLIKRLLYSTQRS